MAEINFNYYHGKESEQFSFFRIPKVLYTDPIFKNLSSDAKVLYGILLDRMELSMKNGWVDENNRVYIYFTIENIMEVMGWGNKKSVKVLSELDTEKGIGLIEKQRQGQGKPTKIYVKNFIVDNFSKMSKGNFKKCQKDNSRNVENTSQEMSKGQGNNTNINNTEFSDTNLILSIEEKENSSGFDRSKINKAEMYRDIIYKNIEYDHYKRYGRYSIDDIENIVELMVDVCVQEGGTVPINGNQMPVEVVKSRFLKLRSSHLEYIMDSLDRNPSEVRNIRNYLLTTIYNAVNTMSQYYRSLVNYNENG
ncbi:DUF6017 domain-containing protein [Clostridium sp. Cult3]|uniref:DUF6017 domain-containing protein n=1 Tax=Clostridium sp. Cult3 TaxID=2079004 RepID=UPI001F37D3D2|nr:replication initiator A domain-containing protein [Clostridium sp. Cult3]